MDDQIKGFSVNAQGYGTIPKAVMQDQCISIMAKALYAYFCSFTGAGDSCFPSRNKICFDLNISKDSVSKYIRELKEVGLIDVEQVKESGKFSYNVYKLSDTTLPCPKLPCPKSTVSVISVSEDLDTKNNSIKNNSIIKKNSNKKEYVPDKPTQTRFIKPTVDEVKEYCEERKNNVDAERFVDYYTANGWKVGKNQMKDWKAAVRTWEKGDKKKNGELEQVPKQQHYGIVL